MVSGWAPPRSAKSLKRLRKLPEHPNVQRLLMDPAGRPNQLSAVCIVARSSWAFPSFHAVVGHETTCDEAIEHM